MISSPCIAQPEIKPFKNREESLSELDRILRKDYGVEMSRERLEQSSQNIKALLTSLL